MLTDEDQKDMTFRMTAVTEVLKRHKRVAKDHEIADRLVGTTHHDNHCTCRPFSRDSTTA